MQLQKDHQYIRRVKRYLRATMLQERLNNLMLLLHVHEEKTDTTSRKTAVNDFIGVSIQSSNIIGKYWVTITIN